MPIQAELKIDPNYFTESLRDTLKGQQGIRNYRVNTPNTAAALYADGVPKKGDLWGDGRVNQSLKVTERETFLIGGKDSGDGTGGWTRVQVLYETPTATPIRIPTDSNTQWTDIIPGRGQYNQIRAIKKINIDPHSGAVVGDEYDDPQHAAIANGEGCQVDYGTCEARVYTFMPLSVGVNLARLLHLSQPSKINDDMLLLPHVYADAIPIRCFKGQVRYVSFELSVAAEFRQLVHVLELAQDFYFRWAPKDQSGQPAAPPQGARVYAYDSFTGLWRQ